MTDLTAWTLAEIVGFLGGFYFAWELGGQTWAVAIAALFIGYSVGRVLWYRRGVNDSDELHRRMYGVVLRSHEKKLFGGSE